MMMRRFIPWLAMAVSLTCLSAAATAEEYRETNRSDSICGWRTLYVMHPGNTKDSLRSMKPNRPSGNLTSGDLVLHSLARDGDTETLRGLIDAGLDANPVNDHGLTPLLIAAAMKHTDIVAALLKSGVDPNWTSKNEHYPCMTTPLHWAAYLGHTDVVTALLDAGADKNAAARNGQTPIDWANFAGRADVLLLLLKAGKGSDSGQGSKKIVEPE